MNEALSDGVTIRYQDVGAGEPALLCLPGWCASQAAFDELTLALVSRRRVLTLDWRGHGASDAAKGDFGTRELMHDALAVIEASRARTIVPLATAHAGWVAIELRRELGPLRIPKLVLVDWIVSAAPPPFLGGLAALQQEESWQAVRDQLFAMWTEGVDHPGVLRFVREDMGSYGFDMWARAGREISAAYASAGSPLEELARFEPPPPTLHLHSGTQHPPTPHWFQAHAVAGRSHFPTIEVPDQLVDPIERFLGDRT